MRCISPIDARLLSEKRGIKNVAINFSRRRSPRARAKIRSSILPQSAACISNSDVVAIIDFLLNTVLENLYIFYYRIVVNFSVYSLDAHLAQKNMV
jgi:hypothetical protein